MTLHANRLPLRLGAAVLLLWGGTMTMSPALAGNSLTSAGAQPSVLAARKEIFIPHGCPYNLDRACIRGPQGKLIKCRCVS
jgi:hypothetical protein